MAEPKNAVDRRTVLAGVGAVGALAAAAALVAGKSARAPEAPQVAEVQPPADTAAGYRLSDHVKRYYQTARI